MSTKIKMLAMAMFAMLNVTVCAQNLKIDKVEIGGREIKADGGKYDLGVLLADKDVCKVTLSNISNGSLTLRKPKTSCGCLSIVEYDKMSIPTEGQMSFSFDYNTKHGNHDKGNKTITISAEDKNGELSVLVMKVKYYALRNSGELAFLERDGKWGAMDINQKTVIPFEYEGLGSARYNDYVRAKKNGKWGLIDKSNKRKVPFEYEDIDVLIRPTDNIMGFFYKAQRNGKWGLVNEENKVLIPFDYEDIDETGSLSDDIRVSFFKVKKNGKWGLIARKDNKVFIPFDYEELKIAGSKFVAKRNGKLGVIDIFGKVKIPFEYEEIDPIVELLGVGKTVIIKKNGKWGKIDENNQVVTPFIYDDIKDVK